ncbi:replicative DNA helicase [Streptomyces sp. p1417]|uniref:Replicative DNA helicase n=1 Tax=Streptomyces typhae TaxID=2681492 RepID=A0A6L6X901_9ACTN|nr:DnaB-like helicase N-terminal domain-containing protein [Streptomyces typhae]MVO90312.1 replicative DNA helicase [Streptomyces typhae]
MPHPTAPGNQDEHDEADGLAPSPPVHYAEQALLGALLLDPERLGEIGALEPEHFANHAHGALFAGMRTVPAPGPEQLRSSPSWLNSVLDAARPQAPGLSASHLHTLIRVCPRPGHAVSYARMIRADHARRSLRLHAARLAQTAIDTTLPHRAQTTMRRADTLVRFLDGLSGSFTSHPSSPPRTPLPPPPARSPEEDALDEERCLLATATAHPADVREMRWLIAADFVLPLHGGLWQCLTTLAHRGDPVDPITVLWQAQHRGLLTPGVDPAGLLVLLSTPAGSPEHWAEKILERSLLARAADVAARITVYADDPANSPHQLITGSRRALADLTTLHTRWQQATRPPLPQTVRPARTPRVPRAGPPPRTAPPVRTTR